MRAVVRQLQGLDVWYGIGPKKLSENRFNYCLPVLVILAKSASAASSQNGNTNIRTTMEECTIREGRLEAI
jgi:hypothetical protein